MPITANPALPPIAAFPAYWLGGCVHGVCILFGAGRPKISHRSVITFGLRPDPTPLTLAA